MPEHIEGENCGCVGCVNRVQDAERKARTKLAMEKRYPMVVAGVVKKLPYTLAKKNTRYSQNCQSETHMAHIPPAAKGSWLCLGCEQGIRDGLKEIEDSWPMLEELLHRGRGKVEERASGSSIHSAAPLDLAPADVMNATSQWLWFQASQWHEDHPDKVLMSGRPAVMVAKHFRVWHSGYFGAHPLSSYPASVPGELAALVQEIRKVVNPDGARHVGIGAHCDQFTVDIYGARVRCPGEIYAVVTDRMSGRPSEIRCSWDSTHNIPQHEWLMLAPKAKTRNGTR